MQSAPFRDCLSRRELPPLRSCSRSCRLSQATGTQLLINSGYADIAFLLGQLQRQVGKITPSSELSLGLAEVSAERQLQLDFLLFSIPLPSLPPPIGFNPKSSPEQLPCMPVPISKSTSPRNLTDDTAIGEGPSWQSPHVT